jgi:hypothetical protein
MFGLDPATIKDYAPLFGSLIAAAVAILSLVLNVRVTRRQAAEKTQLDFLNKKFDILTKERAAFDLHRGKSMEELGKVFSENSDIDKLKTEVYRRIAVGEEVYVTIRHLLLERNIAKIEQAKARIHQEPTAAELAAAPGSDEEGKKWGLSITRMVEFSDTVRDVVDEEIRECVVRLGH